MGGSEQECSGVGKNSSSHSKGRTLVAQSGLDSPQMSQGLLHCALAFFLCDQLTAAQWAGVVRGGQV